MEWISYISLSFQFSDFPLESHQVYICRYTFGNSYSKWDQLFIEVDYYQNGGGATLNVEWIGPSFNWELLVLPTSSAEVCPPCKPGQYFLNGIENSWCMDCSVNTFSNVTNATSCTDCPIGYHITGMYGKDEKWILACG